MKGVFKKQPGMLNKMTQPGTIWFRHDMWYSCVYPWFYFTKSKWEFSPTVSMVRTMGTVEMTLVSPEEWQ